MADSSPRNRAFVSYSHADAEHLTRLHVHLAPYTREHKVDVWDDTRITPGARWKEEIKQAMASAKVAILLVSADFMASEFIARDELPPLLEAAEREGTLIVPVILSPCSFQWSKLARYQSLNAPSDPLIDMPRGKQEAIWAKLAKYVADALAPAASRVVPLQPPLTMNNAPAEPGEPIPTAKSYMPEAHKESEAATLPGTTLLIYRGHSLQVHTVAWSPDGARLASGSLDETVQVWDATTGRRLLTYKGHKHLFEDGDVLVVAWSPDGARLASGGSDKTVQVWDATTGQRLATYKGHSKQVNALAWSSDGTHIASGSNDETVQVWEAATARRLFTYTGHANYVKAVAWSPDGQRLASGGYDNTVQIWHAAAGRHLATYRGHPKWVYALAWSPDGTRIASGGEESLQIWDATTRQCNLTYKIYSWVYTIAWSPDSRYIASSGGEIVDVWGATTSEYLLGYKGHQPHVNAVSWSPDGRRIASAGDDHTIQVWWVGQGT